MLLPLLLLLSVIVLLVVGLPGCVVRALVKRSCTWGGMRGCSYLASYDELLYICVHTPSISPTPTVGLALSWLKAFS